MVVKNLRVIHDGYYAFDKGDLWEVISQSPSGVILVNFKSGYQLHISITTFKDSFIRV